MTGLPSSTQITYQLGYQTTHQTRNIGYSITIKMARGIQQPSAIRSHCELISILECEFTVNKN